jgi:hypothetical protein
VALSERLIVLPLALLLLEWAATPGALAQPSSPAEVGHELQLSWQAPPECPSGDWAVAEIARLAGVPGVGARDALEARVAFSGAAGGGWRVRVETRQRGVSGERTLTGESCPALAAATALILAMTLDPEAVREPPRLDEAPAAPVRPRLDLASAREPPAPGGRALRTELTAGGTGIAGAQPGFGPGLGVGAAVVTPSAWAVELRGLAGAARRRSAVNDPGAGGEFRLFTASLRVCRGRTTPVRFDVRVCAGAALDHLRARGFGISAPRSTAGTWLSPTLGIAAAVPLGARLWLRFDVELSAPAGRPAFTLGGVGEVWRPAPLAARIGAGLVVALP